MGLWWKNVRMSPPEDEERKVTFKGDPGALSKKWPILWRFCQNWHVIKVAPSIRPYMIYFHTESGRTMRCRRSIFFDYVAVRVGTEAVTFWATCGTGINPKMVDTGIMIPGKLRHSKRKEDNPFLLYALKRNTVFV